jgi:hypothetical protein
MEATKTSIWFEFLRRSGLTAAGITLMPQSAMELNFVASESSDRTISTSAYRYSRATQKYQGNAKRQHPFGPTFLHIHALA